MFGLASAVAAQAPTKIADGLYVIIHKDATADWPQGNTTLVIGDSAVLVVDSGYLPSTARADIAAIRALTPVPVRYLVNTHWHYDHHNGNAVTRLKVLAQGASRDLWVRCAGWLTPSLK